MQSLKKRIPIIAVNALLLLAFFACLIASASIRDTLRSQQAAKSWAGQSGDRFSQVSVFIPEKYSFDEQARFSFRSAIDTALVAASIEAEAGRTLYTDAWSAEGDVYVSGGRGAPLTLRAIGVGGDFFLFHPLILRDGSYLSPDDLMKDRVVIDEELAWRLFGSVRVAGLEIEVNGIPHFIAGVVTRENDFASAKAYNYGAGMFMSFESLRDNTADTTRVSTYEIVFPDPITGFALKTVTDAFPDKDALIVENSARYSFMNSLGAIGSFGDRSIRSDRMVYPYWENAARYTEDWLAFLLVLSFLFVACPVVCGVVYGVKVIMFLVTRGRTSVSRLIDERDGREAEKYLLENTDEFADYDIDDIISEFRGEPRWQK